MGVREDDKDDADFDPARPHGYRRTRQKKRSVSTAVSTTTTTEVVDIAITRTKRGRKKFKSPRKGLPRASLTEQDAVSIFTMLSRTDDSNQVGIMFGVDGKTIRDIWNRRTWVKTTQNLGEPGVLRAQFLQLADASSPPVEESTNNSTAFADIIYKGAELLDAFLGESYVVDHRLDHDAADAYFGRRVLKADAAEDTEDESLEDLHGTDVPVDIFGGGGGGRGSTDTPCSSLPTCL